MTTLNAGREYLNLLFRGHIDISVLSDVEVMDLVDASYDGGWKQFRLDHPTTLTPEPTKSVSVQAPTLLQMRAKVASLVGDYALRTILGTYDELTEIEITDDAIKLVIKVHDVTDMSRRVRVNRTGTRLVVFSVTTEAGIYSCRPKQVTIWDDESSVAEIHKFGSISTVQVAADKREQFETCYRPGTSRSPMSGPAARLGVSDREYWKNESYPIPSNKKEN